MFNKILIANRGEIACRVLKSAKKMGIETVAVYSDADVDAVHVRMADEAVHIGPPPAAESYIVIDKIMDAIRQSGAEAVHPGYGFLSENPKFAEALDAEGVAFIGPPVAAIEAMGDKITSKKIAAEAGVSTVPGYMGLVADAEEAATIAADIGYPVMIKASAGGGGKGMRIAYDDEEAREGFERSKSEAASSFGDDRIFIEKFVTTPRHIEIQVLGDKHGRCVYLNERECSIQRRNQKVIEEAPSPFLDEATRHGMGEQAVALAKAVGYHSAGTVEFIVDADRNFYFLEMNTRLQVEHPVTELITGVDLVEEMIKVAAGEPLSISQDDVKIDGWAIESRIYAEDPYRNFLPSIGRLTTYRPPAEGVDAEGRVIRNDTGVEEGGEISMFYDPMIAKLCTWGPDRPAAIDKMREALDRFEIDGIGHNVPFLQAVMDHPRWQSGEISTAFIEEEYPEGFAGVAPEPKLVDRIAAIAAAMHHKAQHREAQISGALSNHQRAIHKAWVVKVEKDEIALTLDRTEDGFAASINGGPAHPVICAWLPGQTLCVAVIDGYPMTLKVTSRAEGWRFRYRGAEIDVIVRTPRAAELARHMIEKPKPDLSKFLICPMPGMVRQIAVEEGDVVEDGQPLATIEAMKMENVLRAERKAKVKLIPVKEGESLAVDAVIMEFE
ncbi:MAG: acetyl/propionyl/methylcrotonyl-CoA carboxylase subunit alpha [Pseudomonadota bacterium]